MKIMSGDHRPNIIFGRTIAERQMSVCHLAVCDMLGGSQAGPSAAVGDARVSNVDSPAVARRRVRLALRAARTAKKLTQSQVARAMDWSLSKVIRIEKGEVNVSPTDLKVLLGHLDVTDPEQVEELLEDARISRRERWTISADDREYLTPAMRELYQFEEDAIAVRYYSNVLVPGPLQTRAYAEQTLPNYPVEHSAERSAARVAVRLRRQERLLRPAAPQHRIVLDESVLMRPFGGPHAMADQLDLLLRLSDRAPVQIRILPVNTRNPRIFLTGPFILIDVEQGRSGLLYREMTDRDEIVYAEAELARHRETFEQMWELALDRVASAELIARQRDKMRADEG